jgi:hypothetical protein
LRAVEESLHHAPASKTDAAWRRETLERLNNEVDFLAFVARCRDARDMGDALISISLVDRTGQRQDAIPGLVGMYQALAARRRMTAEVIGEFYTDSQDRVHLFVGGLGAYGLLKHESGLHQIDRRYKERTARSGRETIREDRELLRVEAASAPNEPSKQFQQVLKTKVAPLRPPKERLMKADTALTIFHEPSLRSVEFWTAGPKEQALARGLLVVKAQVEFGMDGTNGTALVRRYDLGINARIRDMRTGRTTTRVSQAFKGDMETLIVLPDEALR